jgi:hypothetical protein
VDDVLARLVLITGQPPSVLAREDYSMLLHVLEMRAADMNALRGDESDEEFEAWKRANGFA